MIPITALAFLILIYMWSLKLRLSSTGKPISFSQVVASSLTWFAAPSSEFVTMLKVGGVSSTLYPNDSTLHLSGWNLRTQSDVSVLANSCVSLATITAVELIWMESGRSLMYKKKCRPQDWTLWYSTRDMCPFRWIFVDSYSLFSSGKETSYPPQQWPTYAISFYLSEETFMWHLVKGLHKVYVYGVCCPSISNDFGPSVENIK